MKIESPVCLFVMWPIKLSSEIWAEILQIYLNANIIILELYLTAKRIYLNIR